MSNTNLPNASYQQTLDRPSVHVFSSFLSSDLAETHNVNVNVAFPVREVIVRANYIISCNRGGNNYAEPQTFYLTSSYPCFDGGISLGLNAGLTYRPISAAGQFDDYFVTCGNFSNTYLSFTLRQPQMLMGSIPFMLNRVRPLANELFDADVLLDIEFIG